MAEAVTAQYWHSYANIVRNAAIRRRLLEYANNTALLARDEDMDTYRVLGQTELALEKLTSVTLPAGATPAQRDAADLVDEIDLFQRGEKINRLKTGFPSLDNILVGKGLSKSTFTLVSADTSGGKSLFMINVAVNLILSGVPVYWHTVEMSKQDLLIRILARLSGIPEERLKEPGGIKPSEQASYDTAVSKFIAEVSPLLILDSEVKHATLSYSVSAIKRAVREHGIQVAFIDYPGIFDDRELEAVGDRQERLGYMTRRYLQLAQTLEIPIWAAAQQARDDRGDRTGVKGVGESYKTVQHASCFILLRNEDSTDEYSTLKTKIVSVSKQRNGRRGKFTIQADEGTQYCYESTTEPTFDNFSPFD
jgi:replicative DNA helicase